MSGLFSCARNTGAYSLTTGQMAVSDVEQTTTAAEQPLAVAAIAGGAVADAENRTVTSDIDLSTPEAVRKFLAQYPAYEAVQADVRNAERQRLQAEMRREQGSQEAVQKQMGQLIERLNAGEDPNVIAKEVPLIYTAAQDRARVEFAKGLFEQAKALDPDAVAALEGFDENPDLTPEQFLALAQAATNAVANKSKRTGKDEAFAIESIDDIPVDTPLRKAIDAWHQKEIETEMTAQNIEANRREAPPSTSAGTVAGEVDLSRFEGMSEPESAAYMMNLATTNPVEYEKVRDALLSFGR